jgi:hypothetical protein
VLSGAPGPGRDHRRRPGRPARLRLFWNPDRTFDLSDPGMLRWMYENVLREATRPEDLASYLNGDVLVALWPDLFLPKGVRRAWEDHHPALRPAAAPAA